MSKKIRTPIAAILLIVILLCNVYTLITALQYNEFGQIWTRFVQVGIDLALCIILFAKKYNNTLVIVLACQTLLSLINLFLYFVFFNLIILVADALLVLFALAFCEQTLVKTDFSKIREIFKKFYFVPAILYEIPYGYNIYIYFPSIIIILESIISVIVVLNLCMWLKDPYAEDKKKLIEEEKVDAYCGLGKHILLLLFTFGIWSLIWTYRTTKYLNNAPGAEYYNPTKKLLLCMFVPFYSIYWLYKHGQRIDTFTKSKGIHNSDMATLCLILGIFIPIVAYIIMQDKINTLCTKKTTNTIAKEQANTVDELKKYKELLDSDVISQEEFDSKKKQILGL